MAAFHSRLRLIRISTNYFTAKFFGGEVNPNRLILFCEGKQVGYRHLGDIGILDFGSEREPGFKGRFYYIATPLPRELTRGKPI